MSHSIALRKTDPGNHPETIRLYRIVPATISLRRMICQGRGRKRADCPRSSICMMALSCIFGNLFDKPVELRSRIMQRSTSAKVRVSGKSGDRRRSILKLRHRITAGSPSNSLTEIRQYSKETRYGTAEEAAEKAPVRCMSEGPRGLSAPE
jgi:hypothetical protein